MSSPIVWPTIKLSNQILKHLENSCHISFYRFCITSFILAVNIRVTPGSIRVVPYQRFQFECSTSIPGVSPQVTFDERSVERDNRFVVTRPSLQTIVVTAPTGLSEIGAHRFK